MDYRPDPVTRSAAELIWLQVQEKQCWFELLETGKIDWKEAPPSLNLDDMIRTYEKAHAALAPQLSVYIRPMGGRVPSIYGPSADDPGK